MVSLLAQIKAVKSCVEVATGDHLVLQRSALAQLEESLKAARLQQVQVDPDSRRRAVQKQLELVRAKLLANTERLDKARAQVVVLEAFVASQSAKVQSLESELASITAAEPRKVIQLELPDDEEHRLERRLSELRAAKLQRPALAVPAILDFRGGSGGDLENHVAALQDDADGDSEPDFDEDMSKRRNGGNRTRPARPAARPIDAHPHPKEAVADKASLVKKSIGK